MKKRLLHIGRVPAVLWGEPSDRLFIAVHGNMANKEDPTIEIFAAAAAAKGAATLSFDLPEHGARKQEHSDCLVEDAVQDLAAVMVYARGFAHEIGLFACSMGAFFSLCAYQKEPLTQALLLSPVTDMRCMIEQMMAAAGVSAAALKQAGIIAQPGGPDLSWQYYDYVCTHPVRCWNIPTAVLRGEMDTLSTAQAYTAFAARFGQSDLTVIPGAAHWFHTGNDLAALRSWLDEKIDLPASDRR